MSKGKAESATGLVAICGLLTALTGLAQTMWTTSPWWRKDAAPVATAALPPRPHHFPEGYPAAAGDDVTVSSVESAPDDAETPTGVFVLALGVTAAVGGIAANRLLKRKRTRQEDQQMLA